MSHKILLALLASTLPACVVDVDAGFSIDRTCDRSASCTFRGIPASQQDVVPLMLASGAATLPINLDADGVIKAHYGEGPLSLDSALTLDSLEIEPLDGVTLDGVQFVDVVRADGITLASYQPDTAPATSVNTLTLAGNPNVNLLELGTQFTLGFRGAGKLPTTDWMANVTLHAHVRAEAK